MAVMHRAFNISFNWLKSTTDGKYTTYLWTKFHKLQSWLKVSRNIGVKIDFLKIYMW